MCLLIAKPANVELPEDFEEVVGRASKSNPHGCGFSTAGIIIKKYNITDSDFYKLLRENVTKEDPAIIHWRFSTSGTKDDDNCHPFRLNDGGVFAHNGVIAYKYPPMGSKSDTAMLAATTRSTNTLIYRCMDLVSPGNKFAVLTPYSRPDHELQIIGEKHGMWENGLWYSNDNWKTPRTKVTYYQNYRDDDEYYAGGEWHRGGTSATTPAVYNPSTSLKTALRNLIQTHGLVKVVDELDQYCYTQWGRE